MRNAEKIELVKIMLHALVGRLGLENGYDDLTDDDTDSDESDFDSKIESIRRGVENANFLYEQSISDEFLAHYELQQSQFIDIANKVIADICNEFYTIISSYELDKYLHLVVLNEVCDSIVEILGSIPETLKITKYPEEDVKCEYKKDAISDIKKYLRDVIKEHLKDVIASNNRNLVAATKELVKPINYLVQSLNYDIDLKEVFISLYKEAGVDNPIVNAALGVLRTPANRDEVINQANQEYEAIVVDDKNKSIKFDDKVKVTLIPKRCSIIREAAASTTFSKDLRSSIDDDSKGELAIKDGSRRKGNIAYGTVQRVSRDYFNQPPTRASARLAGKRSDAELEGRQAEQVKRCK